MAQPWASWASLSFFFFRTDHFHMTKQQGSLLRCSSVLQPWVVALRRIKTVDLAIYPKLRAGTAAQRAIHETLHAAANLFECVWLQQSPDEPGCPVPSILAEATAQHCIKKRNCRL